MSAALNIDRLNWLEAIAADSRLHASAIRVAIVIASHINRQSGDAWPSIKTIADKSATPERTVKRAVNDLCMAGYLEKRRGGFGKSNRYVMAGNLPQQDEPIPAMGGGTEPYSGATGGPTDTSNGAMGGPNGIASGATGGTSVGPWVAPQLGHGWPTNLLIEPTDRNEGIDISPPTPSCAEKPKAKGGEGEASFEAFYAAYPRKVAKGSARKAWAKAVKLEDPAAIIAGAQRYAAEQRHQEPRFIAHPASWLNDERWQDEPAPVQPSHAVRGGRSDAQERTYAAMQHMRDRGMREASTEHGSGSIAAIASQAIRKVEALK